MAARPYDCSYCGALFPTTFLHMDHVTKVHDRGFVPRSQRTFMAHLRCWRCAGDMPKDADNRYSCPSCGFILPSKAEIHARADSAQAPLQSEYNEEQP